MFYGHKNTWQKHVLETRRDTKCLATAAATTTTTTTTTTLLSCVIRLLYSAAVVVWVCMRKMKASEAPTQTMWELSLKVSLSCR